MEEFVTEYLLLGFPVTFFFTVLTFQTQKNLQYLTQYLQTSQMLVFLNFILFF